MEFDGLQVELVVQLCVGRLWMQMFTSYNLNMIDFNCYTIADYACDAHDTFVFETRAKVRADYGTKSHKQS